MIRLSTIGQVSLSIGETRLSPSNHQAFSALFYLTVECGRPISRRTLAEMFFPLATAGGHSVRQLVYRLRKLGVPLHADQTTVTLPSGVSTWDVDALISRGIALERELEDLAKGFLIDFAPQHSKHFDSWLEQLRGSVSSNLRHVLLTQLAAERERRRYRTVGLVARACLALDPLNEEATLSAAEALASIGSKLEAISLLDRYMEDLGLRSSDLRVAPRLLRERIAEYVTTPEQEPVELIGRESELAVLISTLDKAAAGSAGSCIVTGPSGIGKSRLLEEACAIAALSGHAIVRARLQRHDVTRPFAVLRDLGPALLDLRGAIGAPGRSLTVVRGLCGRGPTTHRTVPNDAFETNAVLAEVHGCVIELVEAVLDEQPVVLLIEDAQWIDDASLHLLAEILDGSRAICVMLASQRRLELPTTLVSTPAFTHLALPPLTQQQSKALLTALFGKIQRQPDQRFLDSAAATAGGVPFFLNLLFQNFLTTEDPEAVPSSLSASLAARLDQLGAPAKEVFDAVVVLGPYSSVTRLEELLQIPRYLLLSALRWLEDSGFVKSSNGIVTPYHDLLAAAARTSMPAGIARLLHRATAGLLEGGTIGAVEPLAIASHWEASGESNHAIRVLTESADQYSQLGRPREAIDLLQRARHLAHTEAAHRTLDVLLLHTCRAAGEDGTGVDVATRLGLYADSADPHLQVIAFEFLVGAGQELAPHAARLEAIAANRTNPHNVRAHAARTLAILAEDLGDEPLCARAVALVADTDPSCEVICTELIYHTVFGSKKEAIALCAHLYDAASALRIPSERVKYVFNAGVGMWRYGECEPAIRYSEEAYQIAYGAKVWSACTAFASIISEFYWTTGEQAASAEWFAKASEHIRRSRSSDRLLPYVGIALLHALDNNDPGLASSILDKAERLFPRIHGHRMGLHRLAFRIRIALANQQIPSPEDIRRLVEGHVATRGQGLHDVCADTVIAVLKATNQPVLANQYRGEYLKVFRKDQYPVAPSFLHLAATG